MARTVRLAAAQMGATHRTDTRQKTMNRMLALLREAADKGAQCVLYPETAFTTFFPRYIIDDPNELESWFEHGNVIESPNTRPLFDAACRLGVDVCVGFAEATETGEHFNSCIYYHAKTGSMLSKYRKIHLPGDYDFCYHPDCTHELEKHYFKAGNLGLNAFRVPDMCDTTATQGEPIFGLLICYDRRWAEAWRVLGLQGTEVVLCGYNTAGYSPSLCKTDASKSQDPKEYESTATFQHQLVMQAHSYTNACFSVSAGRAGYDDGKHSMIGGSCITGPDGRILIEAKTLDDEVIVADCDLDLCKEGKTKTFDLAMHRQPEHYARLIEQTEVVEPPRLRDPKTIDHALKNMVANGQTPPASGRTSPFGAPSSVGPAGNSFAAQSNTRIQDGSSSTTNITEVSPVGATIINSQAMPNINKIRILLINPNATKTMTDSCLKMVQPTLSPDVTVTGFTSPAPAPTAIEGNFDSVMSAAAAIRAIIPMAHDYDAFLVACYSDHSLIRMLREEFTQPCIGIMEASLYAARTLGNRFGIIATSWRSKVMHEDAVRHYGFDGFCAGVGCCNLGVLDLERKDENEVLGIMCNVARDMVGQGADCLTLGCAGMARLKSAVEEAVGEDVQVIDGVLAGVQHLSGLVRMGGRTSKRGFYSSSAAGRQARGQSYY